MRDEGAGHPPRRRPSKVSGVTETFVDSGGVRIWTVSQGVGHPVVLCNGGAGCCDCMLYGTGRLAASQVRRWS